METALDIAGRFIPESPRCGDLELAILRHMEHHVAKADNRWRDTIRELRLALEAAKIPHLVVGGDCWFSCPMSGECCNDEEPVKCNCGADEHNAKIAAALALR